MRCGTGCLPGRVEKIFPPATIRVAMKPLADCRLYAFVDTAYLHGRAPAIVAQQLCDGGADLIQLRAKTSSRDEVRRLAEALAPIMRAADVGLVINDYADIAREVGARASAR